MNSMVPVPPPSSTENRLTNSYSSVSKAPFTGRRIHPWRSRRKAPWERCGGRADAYTAWHFRARREASPEAGDIGGKPNLRSRRVL